MTLRGCNANHSAMHVLLLIAHLCCACLIATKMLDMSIWSTKQLLHKGTAGVCKVLQ